MIHARRRHPAFGLGTFTDLGGSNPSVLSYVREHTDAEGERDVILCVNNLSRFPQPVELDLRHWEGMVPGRAARRRAVPGHRRAALPADPRRLRLLLDPADRRTTERGGPRDDVTRRADQLHGLHRRRPLVRRQGPRLRRSARCAASARCPARRRASRWSSTWSRSPTPTASRRALPAAAGALPRPAGAARARADRSVDGADGRHVAPTTPCTTATRWRCGCGLRVGRRRQGDRRRARLPPASPATSSTPRRTPRSSPASSPTPRSPSARTR